MQCMWREMARMRGRMALDLLPQPPARPVAQASPPMCLVPWITICDEQIRHFVCQDLKEAVCKNTLSEVSHTGRRTRPLPSVTSENVTKLAWKCMEWVAEEVRAPWRVWWQTADMCDNTMSLPRCLSFGLQHTWRTEIPIIFANYNASWSTVIDSTQCTFFTRRVYPHSSDTEISAILNDDAGASGFVASVQATPFDRDLQREGEAGPEVGGGCGRNRLSNDWYWPTSSLHADGRPSSQIREGLWAGGRC
ncbi:hypothetical protein SARC_07462 [Sphaeroforma arctica JP610]|uniref:Uncharacterized protein n=1 Tax=Sphaeroforma arctica JP610 TaxID=667725 RepID=A0A0L0FU32_9EUKA|nr:hypothetical protein SARC_07462 [Sphaeroforma arctica JP610]KNC80169.1 hypothetical protein SARC_07462 [Sphaeroforma arctica JP610]|eukprot:XP_014154071.1 hypothetical protein SARC_07462 [Sphaeroforma arctica JP610]